MYQVVSFTRHYSLIIWSEYEELHIHDTPNTAYSYLNIPTTIFHNLEAYRVMKDRALML